jgi:hypothetical protein
MPNWQHHSKKEQKRHLKPQKLRQARKRRAQLKNRLLGPLATRQGSYTMCIHRDI